jgi:spore germination cell wall hydrolase CwlJ-like protein
MSRVASHHFPDTPCEVIKQGGERKYQCQFSYWCDGKPETIASREAYGQAVVIAAGVYFSLYPDLTGQATHYHADYVQPNWAKHLHQTTKIGRHIFYRM